MKYCFGLIVISVFLVLATVRAYDDGTPSTLHEFEIDWLTVNLNGDLEWLEIFSAGKMGVVSGDKFAIDQRSRFTAELLDPTVSDDARKVRIKGTIQFLTNDPARDRTFQFLDTFNRRGGKWEVIASSFPISDGKEESVLRETASGPLRDAEVEKEIRKLEFEAARAILNKDEKSIARFFTKDSVTNDPRNGLTKGSSGVINAARSNLINYRSFERNVESVQVLGDTAITMGNEVVTTVSADGRPDEIIQRRYTNVWMKRGEAWMIVARHANVIHRSN